MKNLVTKLVFVFNLVAVAFSSLDVKADPISSLRVPITSEDRDLIIEGATYETPDDKLPEYARWFCPPFRYENDVLNDGENSFTVCGINSNEVLKAITSITGVRLNTLEKRAVGLQHNDADLGVTLFQGECPVEWKGINNLSARHSGQGFIWESQSLRALLLQDNYKVFERCRLTHQKLARPLLIALREFETKKKGEKGVEFSYEGEGGKWLKYRVDGEQMGANSGLQIGADMRNVFRSGWVGIGVQGSFFNDELFADWIFKITKLSGDKKGSELSGDALTPHLIYRYGFYQGAYYRIHPERIARFFELSDCMPK